MHIDYVIVNTYLSLSFLLQNSETSNFHICGCWGGAGDDEDEFFILFIFNDLTGHAAKQTWVKRSVLRHHFMLDLIREK